jgi:peroxiredoxin Q/BCP
MSHTILTTGDKVPNIKLPASNGKTIGLADYAGKKLVLYFYPKDMTPGCTVESCDFRDFSGQFAQHNTEVLGVSPDDLSSHMEFIQAHELPFPLLSDANQLMSEQFGTWKLRSREGVEFMGMERSTFLIDENGVIVREWRSVNVDGHVQEVLAAASGA